MTHPGVRVLLVTGGPGVVPRGPAQRQARDHRRPGNPPAVVDQTADIERAARDIVRGASSHNKSSASTRESSSSSTSSPTG